MTDDLDAVHVETARLILRTVVEDDEALYCDLFGDPATMQFIGSSWSRERALQSFCRTLARIRQRPVEHVLLTIVDKATRHAFGICSLQRFDHARRSAEMGIMLEPRYHAQGLGKEAVATFVSWGFAALPLDEMRMRVVASNAAATGVCTRVGFVRDREGDDVDSGVARHAWYARRASWSTTG